MKTLIPLIFILLIACKSDRPCSAYTLNSKSMTLEEINQYYDNQIKNSEDDSEEMGIEMERTKALREGKIPEVNCNIDGGCETCSS